MVAVVGVRRARSVCSYVATTTTVRKTSQRRDSAYIWWYQKGLFDAEVTRAIFWGLGFFSFDDFYDDGDLRMTPECVVQMLLNQSLDVDVINHEGQPLLHYTTRGGHSRVVQITP